MKRVTLWCKLLGRLIEAETEPCAGPARPVAGLPEGWTVSACLGRTEACYRTGCPFTTDSQDSPFGEVGEREGEPPERLDPSAESSFEGEWD